jgi:hypothetical protein
VGTGLPKGEVDSLPHQDTDEKFNRQLLTDLRFINPDQFEKEQIDSVIWA